LAPILFVLLLGFGASLFFLRDNGLADTHKRQQWVIVMSVLVMCLAVLLVWAIMID